MSQDLEDFYDSFVDVGLSLASMVANNDQKALAEAIRYMKSVIEKVEYAKAIKEKNNQS